VDVHVNSPPRRARRSQSIYTTYDAADELLREAAPRDETAPHPTVRVDEMDEVDEMDAGSSASVSMKSMQPIPSILQPAKWAMAGRSLERPAGALGTRTPPTRSSRTEAPLLPQGSQGSPPMRCLAPHGIVRANVTSLYESA